MEKNSPKNRVYIFQSHKQHQELHSLELHIIQYGFKILIWFIVKTCFLNMQFLALGRGFNPHFGRLRLGGP